MCIGGPALIYYVTPTEEELFLVRRPILRQSHYLIPEN